MTPPPNDTTSANTPVGSDPDTSTIPPTPAGGHSCAHCASAMVDGQDWCLHCGAGAPQALRTGPGWRSLVGVVVVTCVLAVGAAAAAYAALSEPSRTQPKTAVANTPASTTPTGATPTSSIPTIPSTPEVTSTPTIPAVPSSPPKIPLSTPTPETSGKSTEETTRTSTTTKTESKSTSSEETGAILLDTDAASTYNPYEYPASGFGEPGLAIDGDPNTTWSAAVQASAAPLMAEGLVIDLKSAQKVGRLQLITPSKGMTIEVYGARGQKPPATITDPGWIQLAPSRVVKKSKATFKLRESSKAFRFIVLWITKAPDGSTPTEPGQVKVGEVTLYPAA